LPRELIQQSVITARANHCKQKTTGNAREVSAKTLLVEINIDADFSSLGQNRTAESENKLTRATLGLIWPHLTHHQFYNSLKSPTGLLFRP
jgi:hypothetical protein